MSEQQAVAPSTQIAVYQPIEAGIIEFLARHQNVVHDVTTTKGMEAARKDRAECRSLRVKLEDARVREKAESLAYGRKVDDEAKRIRTIIEPVEDRYDAQIKAEEQRKEAEKAERLRIEIERIAALRARVDAISRAPLAAVGKTSAQIAAIRDELRDTIIDEDFAEFEQDARNALAGSLAQLELSRQAAEAQEAEQARIVAERLRIEQDAEVARKAREFADAKARAEREEEDRKRRAELAAEEDRARALREAEEARMAQERAELDRQRAEAEARRQADDERRRREEEDAKAERDRIAAERAKFEAAQKRAASLLKARRGTAAIALSDIIGICRNINGYSDSEARAEIALIAEATLYPTKPAKQKAA